MKIIISLVLLILINLSLFSCSSPEDSLWGKRISQPYSQVDEACPVLALNLDLQQLLTPEDSLKIQQEAQRDLLIYLFGKPTNQNLDTAKFLQDSVLNRLYWNALGAPLLNHLSTMPTYRQMIAWSLEQAKQSIPQQLICMQNQLKIQLDVKDHFLIPQFQMPYSQGAEVRIPMGLFLVKHGEAKIWLKVELWNLTIEGSTAIDHIDLQAMDLHGKLIGQASIAPHP